MEELRVTNLLGGALAAISGAVVASFLGVFGTLAGAGVMSIFMAVATAGYAHSLATALRWLRRTLRRKAGGETDAGTPPAQPLRWQRVALAAAVFAIAMGAGPRWRRPPGGRLPACSAASQHEGEHVGRGGGGAVGGTDAPGAGHLRHLAADIGAHHDDAGRGDHDDHASGHHPQHHGADYDTDHEHPKHAGPNDLAALTSCSRTPPVLLAGAT